MLPFADNNPNRITPLVTWSLIGFNTAIFLLGLRLSDQQLLDLHLHRGFIPARVAQLTHPDQNVIVPLGKLEHRFGPGGLQNVAVLGPNRREIVSSLVTSQFLHGGWAHLLGNMLFLFIFGNNVEERLGHTAYLAFYLVGGVAAAGLHWAFNPLSVLPTIGASGAVAAVLGAYAVTWPHARIHTLVPLFVIWWVFELPAWVVLGFWFVGQLLDGLQMLGVELGGGVAFWAHIGGFLFGAIIMWLINQRDPPSRYLGQGDA